MFGIKIISEEKYQSEQITASKLMKVNEELVKKNAALEVDIKNLREQNSKLRKINAKRKEVNNNLIEKNHKLKEKVKEKQNVKFDKNFTICTPEHCDTCTHEQQDCKKYYLERKTDVICICPKPSFRDKK